MQDGPNFREEAPAVLQEYRALPSRVLVNRRYEVRQRAGEITLEEEPVPVPYVKDYDSISPPDEWLSRWDLSRWRVISAFESGARIGWGVMAWNTPGVDMLDGRHDVAVLWDLRVAESCRRRGVATELVRRAREWAISRECAVLKVETQNTNVAACRLYFNAGCRLEAAHRGVYEDPAEVQLLWRLNLDA